MPITIYAGTVGANKSTKLIAARNDFDNLSIKYEALNYTLNDRYGKRTISSHTGSKIPAHDIGGTRGAKKYLEEKGFFRDIGRGGNKQGIIIEEGQFSDEEILKFLEKHKNNFDIHISMLIRDFGARPFRLRSADGTSFSDKTTTNILELSDFIDVNMINPAKCTYTFANGEKCGEKASETQKYVRLNGEKLWTLAPYDPDKVIEVGGVGSQLTEEKKDNCAPYEVIYKARDGDHFAHPEVMRWEDEEGLVKILKEIYSTKTSPFMAKQAL